MKKTRKFDELMKACFTPKERAEIQANVEVEVCQLRLREMREMLGKTQIEAGDEVDVAQAEISKMERRDDHLLSTVRRYVHALGGELEVVAHFGNKRFTLLEV